MKKILVASTALVAASMLSTGAASASEKIKLELGGFSKWWVVGAWQDDSFQSANNADYNSVDIKGDNEIFFSGSTTLDNGMQVGINVELEAGGTTDNTADTIDKSNVFIAGGFGKVILGSEANGTVLLHVMAPDAAGNTDSDGLLTGGLAIAAPTGFTGRVVTSIDTDGDAEGITYVAPTFYGLTVGGTYKPNSTQDNRGATSWNSSSFPDVATGEIYGAGALYANTFSGVDFKASAGWATYDVNVTDYAVPSDNQNVNEYAFGTQIGYAGFTVGGSYRIVSAPSRLAGTVAADGRVWDAGIQYASGPYAVSFIYFDSEAQRDQIAEDNFTVYQVSGKYTLGAGVDVLATVGHADYDSDVVGDANDNQGWMVATGLSLQF